MYKASEVAQKQEKSTDICQEEMKPLGHRFPFYFCFNHERVAITSSGAKKAELPQDKQTKIPAVILAYL